MAVLVKYFWKLTQLHLYLNPSYTEILTFSPFMNQQKAMQTLREQLILLLNIAIFALLQQSNFSAH